MGAAEDRFTVVASVARWAAVAGLTLLFLPLVRLGRLISEERGRDIVVTWARLMNRTLAINVEVDDENAGRYDDGPYVFVLLNQSSITEYFAQLEALPLPARPMPNAVVLLPVLGWMLLAQGSIVLLPGLRRHNRRALARAERVLRRGGSVFLSIEGTRTHDGTLMPYRKGPAILAIAAGAPIVPVVMRGGAAILPRGEWRPRPGTVRAKLLAPIPMKGLRYEDRDLVVAMLREVAERELALET